MSASSVAAQAAVPPVHWLGEGPDGSSSLQAPSAAAAPRASRAGSRFDRKAMMMVGVMDERSEWGGSRPPESEHRSVVVPLRGGHGAVTNRRSPSRAQGREVSPSEKTRPAR